MTSANPFEFPEPVDWDSEVTSDAMQLMTVCLFNGVCHVVRILAGSGLLSNAEIQGIHEAMTAPLLDPDHQDDPTVREFLGTLECVLAKSAALARSGLVDDRRT